MTIKEIELIKTQSEALDVSITVNHYDVNRFSVMIGSHVYTRLDRALSALTTKFLKKK